MGQYPEAAEKLYEAIALAEKHDAPRSIFNARHELGYVFMQMDKQDEALEIFRANEAMAPSLGDPYKKSVAYGDLGLYYAEIGDHEQALQYDLKDLAVQEETGETKDLPLIYNNISANYLALERYEQAIQYLQKSLALEGQHRAAYNHILSTIQLGIAYQGLGQLPAARRYLESGLVQAQGISNPQLVQDAREALVAVAQAMNDYQLAHETNVAYHLLRDSLQNLEKNRQLDELRTQYEAEKQAQQIELLQKDAVINEAQQRQLSIALWSVILLGAMIALNLWQKRRKDRRIFEQEQAIEQERRRNVELHNEQLNRELDFKKQELAAKVLQLCKKNEFLHELEKQVASLPVNGNAEARRSSAQLSRLIQRDIAAEEDWDGFIHTFTEVHPSFLRDLHAEHGDLTKSELRLACLLRMNISPKDIANLLNISSEGVKKARYRLRKKLTLPTERELEGYLINL
jgi:DNA-binding CsgD family transcriptional regulator